MDVKALNCPNCGAGGASDSSECQFCKTRLRTVACTTCFGLMFVGSKFCDHCGAVAAPAAFDDGEELGDCPRCRVPLGFMRVGQTNLRECSKCDGLWADVATFETICADREKQSAVLGFIGQRTLTAEPLTKISYVRCPDCNEMMNRSNFARASGVIVDICKKDGVWFDADEMPRIIEFIQKGGMELARQREKSELQNERDRLRDEQRRLGLSDTGFGIGGMFEKEDNSAVRNFVRSLFN